MHKALKVELDRRKLELSVALEEQRRIISEATAYAQNLDNALSAVNLALGTLGNENKEPARGLRAV